MQPSDIKSRPVYATLRPVPDATQHIVAAAGEGALAVAAAFEARGGALSTTTILYTEARQAASAHAARLAALDPRALHVLPSVDTLLTRLRALLATAHMGTRLYAGGSEDFLGRVRSLAMDCAVDADAIQCEHRGTPARRVQCVHCKGFTTDVLASPVRCAHCGIPLLVRDHYSRRLGAFMGVSIDAEAPGEIPAVEEFRP